MQLCSDGIGAAHPRIWSPRPGSTPARLQIEVTETALLGDFDAARRNLSQLARRRACGIVLDDFGAGYASISYLREMKFDAVKLDGSLVSAADSRPRRACSCSRACSTCAARSACRASPSISRPRQQVALLRELGCRYGQGYWLARPMSAEHARQVAQAELIAFAPVHALKKWARPGVLRPGGSP